MTRYSGSRVSLTPASRLVLSIADVDNYRLLVDGLELQCSIMQKYQRLGAELDTKLDACKAVLKSASLRRFVHFMLYVGNILNEVTCAAWHIVA